MVSANSIVCFSNTEATQIVFVDEKQRVSQDEELMYKARVCFLNGAAWKWCQFFVMACSTYAEVCLKYLVISRARDSHFLLWTSQITSLTFVTGKT